MIHRVAIELERVEPRVSRVIEVPSDWSVSRLCDVIQRAMGWDGAHLDELRVGKTVYNTSGERYGNARDGGAHTVSDALPVGAKGFYLYDFGDSWSHRVHVRAVEPDVAGVTYPRCIAGERACPPDDCGGPYGYAELLASADDEDGILGEQFDPEVFDIDRANRRLRAMVPLRVRGDLERLVRLLRQEKLPEKVAAQVLAWKTDVVPLLLNFLDDERFREETAPGRGRPPVHAATLLGRMGDARAVAALAGIVAKDDFETHLTNAAVEALPKLGAAIVEPCLSMLEYGAHAVGLLGALANCGVRDERIYSAIMKLMDHDVTLGAAYFAEYGDERAIVPLSAKLDAIADDFERGFAAVELGGALERLGGVLRDDQCAKVERAVAIRRGNRAPTEVEAS